MHKLDEHIGVAVAGINSDANILINSARWEDTRIFIFFNEEFFFFSPVCAANRAQD